MKTFTTLLIILMSIYSLNAHETVSGSTLHYHNKPGAPLDMTFSSEKIDLNETADINITLQTTINKGTVFVNALLDPELEVLNSVDKNTSFEIQPNQKTFIMNFEIKSKKEGLYYIKLLTKVKTDFYTKLRYFAVPVYVGQYQKPVPKSLSTSQLKATGVTENISVSKAKETIEVIQEK